ncbi:NmrA family NAD(P)-binding protein [Neorhizobium sp. LMR1-1-1.1]
MTKVPAHQGSRIAVVGATGRIGSALLNKLADDDVDIIPLSRSASSDRLPPGLVPTIIDFEAPLTLSKALEGVDKAFIAHGTYAKQVENEIALIDAAVGAGVSHIVKVSVMGPPVRLHPFDWHAKIEAHLAACDIGYTLLRPSAFVDILARAAVPVADGFWGGAAGEGRVNFIDTRDIADVARVVLLDDRFNDVQRAYHLTGPASVSMPEVAAELSVQLGREVRYLRRTPSEHRNVLLQMGMSEMAADIALGLDHLFERSVQAETTNTVAELTGNVPRSVAEWLKDNISTFKRNFITIQG